MHLHDQSAQMIRRKDEVRYNQINRTHLFDPETKWFLCSSRVRDTHTYKEHTRKNTCIHTYISAVHQPNMQFYTIRHMSLHICSPCPHCLQCKFWIATHGISILGFIWCIFLQQCFFLLLHDHALNILPARTCCNINPKVIPSWSSLFPFWGHG